MPSCQWPPHVDGAPSKLYISLLDLGYKKKGADEIYEYAKRAAKEDPSAFQLNDQGEPTLESIFPESFLKVLRENRRALKAETLASGFSEMRRHLETALSETPENRRLRVQKEIAKRIVANVHSQVDLLRGRDTPNARRETAKRGAEVKRLEDLLIRGETERVLIEYAESAAAQVEEGYKNLKAKLDQGQPLSLTSIFLLQEFVKAFGAMPDIRNAIADDPVLRDKFGATVLPILDAAIQQLTEIQSRLSDTRLEAATRRLAPLMESVDARWRRDLLRRFDESVKEEGLEAPEIEARRRTFLAEELEKNRDLIEAEKREHARQMLREVPRDITWTEQWLDAMQHTTDEILQILQDIWQRKRSAVRDETEAANERVRRLWDKLSEYKGNPADQRALYEEMLDGVYLVGKYDRRFAEELERMREETRITEDDTFESAEEKRRKKQAWYETHTEREFTDTFYEIWNRLFEGPSKEQRRITLEIADLLKPYRRYGEDNYYDEIPNDIAEKIKELEAERRALRTSDDFQKRLEEEGFDNLDKFVKFVETREYHETYAKKKAQGEAVFDAWFKANHYKAPKFVGGKYAGEVDRPLAHWTQPVAVQKAHYNPRYVRGEITPKEVYRSKKYEALMALPPDHPVRAFWEAARREIIEADKQRPLGKRLSERIGDDHFVRLPGVRKSYVERAASEGRFSAAKEYLKENWTIQEGDEDVVETFGVPEGPEGTERKIVPVYYQQKLSEKDQSFDVARLLVMNRWATSNYRHMSEIAPEMEVIYSVLESRKVQSERRGRKITGRTSKDTLRKDPPVKAVKLLRSFLDASLYGEKNQSDSVGTDTQRRVDLLMKYVSTTLLSGNLVAAISNVNTGMVNTMLEGMAGGKYTFANWAKAQATYWADYPHIFSDLGKVDYESKTNQLSLIFDALNDWRGPRVDFARNSIWKRNVKEDRLHALNSMGEHFIQHVAMYALLDSIGTMDAGGNVLPMTLKEAFEMRDGKVVLNEKVKSVVMRDGRVLEWNEDTLYRIKRQLWNLNEHLHGAYSEQNENMAQRFIMGRMLHMMRKWIRPGIRRRYSGLGRALKGEETMRYDYQGEEFVEGYYTTLIRTLMRIGKDARFNMMQWWGEWQNLSEYERKNIRKAVYEFGFAVAALQVSAILESVASEAGEDDEDWWWLAAYQTHRLWTELSFYWHPGETLNIIRHPMPTATMLEKSVAFLSQIVFEPGERYQRGSREGDLKIWKKMEDLLPWWQQATRLMEMQESYEYLANPRR